MVFEKGKEYLTVAEIRRYLNISQATTYELVHRKNFPVTRIDSNIRIQTKAFPAWWIIELPFPASC